MRNSETIYLEPDDLRQLSLAKQQAFRLITDVFRKRHAQIEVESDEIIGQVIRARTVDEVAGIIKSLES